MFWKFEEQKLIQDSFLTQDNDTLIAVDIATVITFVKQNTIECFWCNWYCL